MDATAAITLAAGGEWLSETLDVLFGKRDVYPGAVVLPNRSAGDSPLTRRMTAFNPRFRSPRYADNRKSTPKHESI